MEEAVVILTTWPNADAARTAARTLIDERLAACANILPGIESIYRWQGAIEASAEVLMILKSTIGQYLTLEKRLKALHPYEVPEILSLPVRDGFLPYLQWVQENCG
jgi:periplasmic divalent cation tolerance protein